MQEDYKTVEYWAVCLKVFFFQTSDTEVLLLMLCRVKSLIVDMSCIALHISAGSCLFLEVLRIFLMLILVNKNCGIYPRNSYRLTTLQGLDKVFSQRVYSEYGSDS